MVNLGPLITAYTGGAECSSYTGFTQSDWGDQSLFLIQGPVPTQDCLPSKYNPASDAYYSPGICPVGYTVACSSINSIGTVSETIQTCCPSYPSLTYSCLGADANVHINPWQQTLGCTRRMPTATTLAPLTSIANGNTQILPMSTYNDPRGGMGAYAVVVRHQDQDLTSTPTATSSRSSSSSISTSSSASASSSTSTSVSGSNGAGGSSSTSGLSTGAIAGVAVGCVAAVVLLGLGFFLCLRKRSRNHSHAELDGREHYSPKDSPAETMAYPVDTGRSPVTYAGSSPSYTLSSPKSPAELGDSTTYELGPGREKHA